MKYLIAFLLPFAPWFSALHPSGAGALGGGCCCCEPPACCAPDCCSSGGCCGG
ncbi:MAG TPA: hypothetical protein VK081_05150 [Planctomycetota bacterium]|nr:hypothetical protein [Planctomycetota bacterium]